MHSSTSSKSLSNDQNTLQSLFSIFSLLPLSPPSLSSLSALRRPAPPSCLHASDPSSVVTTEFRQISQECEDDDAEKEEEFVSVASCFSCCSASVAASNDAFLSVKASLSRCSSLDGFDFYFSDFEKRQSIIRQLCHCEGWPFGLCRKAVLLPPLPKSPSESWTWHKSHKGIDTEFQSSPFRSYTMKHQT